MSGWHKRLYEAFQCGRGVHLTAQDVLEICQDDAVRTMLTNTACQEGGVEEAGADCIRVSGPKSWSGFVREMKSETEW